MSLEDWNASFTELSIGKKNKMFSAGERPGLNFPNQYKRLGSVLAVLYKPLITRLQASNLGPLICLFDAAVP